MLSNSFFNASGNFVYSIIQTDLNVYPLLHLPRNGRLTIIFRLLHIVVGFATDTVIFYSSCLYGKKAYNNCKEVDGLFIIVIIITTLVYKASSYFNFGLTQAIVI